MLISNALTAMVSVAWVRVVLACVCNCLDNCLRDMVNARRDRQRREADNTGSRVAQPNKLSSVLAYELVRELA